MTAGTETLPLDLVERVLAKLGLDPAPPLSLEGLERVYHAWCRRVPFDNVLKLIYLGANATGPLPGDEPAEFFESWLRYGTGGTCWAANGALRALVSSLGFTASGGIGTMMGSPTSQSPPNHGTVVVTLENSRYIVDASILHGTPLRLDERTPAATVHPAWGVPCEPRDGRWFIVWRPPQAPQGVTCRIERLQADAEEFHAMHEATRPWSLFNYALSVRLIRGDTMDGAGVGRRVILEADGGVSQRPLVGDSRARFLIEELGMSEEIVSQLPPDRETPPAPWAR